MLQEKEAFVSFHDPHITELCTDSIRLQGKTMDQRTLESADCVVIVTDHSSYDWQFVVDHSRLIVDTRNATRKTNSASGRIVKL
jgi:UDP-N-acetyl-D-glucosamine dehydrogenase